ncbi:hypothetical protein ANN_25934, partial [Periplaneta americana]
CLAKQSWPVANLNAATDDLHERFLKCFPVRYLLCFMCFTGIVLNYSLKASMSVAIVAMVRHTYVPYHTVNVTMEKLDICPIRSTDITSYFHNGEFDWDEATQSHIMTAFFCGYVATQLLGGRLSELYGSKIVVGPGVFLTGMLSLLSPVAARLHVVAFIIMRVLSGAASGVIIPSVQGMVAKWWLVKERTLVGGIIIASLPVSVIISQSMSGVMAEFGGWPMIFYVFGGLSVLWCIPWIFIVYDTPESHPFISTEEKSSILASIGSQEKESLPVPWLAILTSLPMWANTIMTMGTTWIGETVLTQLPTYFSNVLHFNLSQSGISSALPFIALIITEVCSSLLSQWIQTKGYVSKLMAYHIFNTVPFGCCIDSFGVAICLLCVTLVGCDSIIIVLLMILLMATDGIYAGGSLMNYLDLGSNYAGTLSGFMHTFTNMTGMLTPIVAGLFINGQETLTQWNKVFYVSIAVKLATYVVFLVFGSTESQPWNKPDLQ